MEYIIEKEQKIVKLNDERKLCIAKKIAEDYQTYDRGRQSQLDKAKCLIDEIYFKNAIKKEDDPDKKWKSTVKTCKIFMLSQILKAFIWKNTYANTNSMFDVSGEDLEADNNSNKQKTMLVDVMEKMEYSKTLDKIIDKSLVYGDLISFSTWKKKTEEYRRPISFFDSMQQDVNKLPKILAAKAKGENFYVDERIIYDNPYTYDVDPANFVFDATQFADFDSCPKIYRTWRTPDYIINNKYFEVSKEVAADLKAMVKDAPNEGDVSNQESQGLRDEYVNGSTVEMLEHWGDLTLKDGTVLKNWYAVVVANKYLVRFEKNPFIINPFTYGCYLEDPDTHRGISPLFSIYGLAGTQEDMLRRTMDLQALTENPPVYAGKGFFENNGDIELHPGKIIEYDNALYGEIPVKPMQFDTNVFKDDLSYLDDLMSEISGIFPNMAGASENDRTTATEISTKVEGQLTRLKMLLDIINQYLILSSVKVIAKLKANFTFGDEEIFINNNNQPENVTINDDVRQADYRYTYADRSATSERFNYVDMVAQAIQMFIKSGLQTNLEEVFKWYMEQKGVENPERFLMQMNLIDPMVQEALLQNPQLAPIIQEMQTRVEMAKQGQQIPGEEEMPDMAAPEQAPPPEELPDKLQHLPGRHLLSE